MTLRGTVEQELRPNANRPVAATMAEGRALQTFIHIKPGVRESRRIQDVRALPRHFVPVNCQMLENSR